MTKIALGCGFNNKVEHLKWGACQQRAISTDRWSCASYALYHSLHPPQLPRKRLQSRAKSRHCPPDERGGPYQPLPQPRAYPVALRHNDSAAERHQRLLESSFVCAV